MQSRRPPTPAERYGRSRGAGRPAGTPARTPARSPARGRAAGGDAEGLTAQLADAVATARRRAARDGDRQFDTAHLLHSLLESDRAVWGYLDGGGPQAGKLLGYLVQRSIGYGLRWHGSVEDSGAVPALRDQPGGLPGWSPVAAAALERAKRRARWREAPRVEGVDLFAALVADEECRAVEVLRGAGVDTQALAGRLHADRGGPEEDGRGSVRG